MHYTVSERLDFRGSTSLIGRFILMPWPNWALPPVCREHSLQAAMEALPEDARYREPHNRALLATQSAKGNRWQIFFRDMIEVLDIVCRMRDTERNPTGFSKDEAPILGLLVRTCKLLRTTTWAFDNGKARCALISERAAIEAAVMAQYLMRSGSDAVADYRRCAFRDRLEILRRAEEGDSVVCGTPAGQRIVRSIKEKLSNEGLTNASFGTQERHRWRVGGHPFRHIFKTVIGDSMYDAAYRMGSDAVHGSWSDLCMFWLVSRLASSMQNSSPFRPRENAIDPGKV